MRHLLSHSLISSSLKWLSQPHYLPTMFTTYHCIIWSLIRCYLLFILFGSKSKLFTLLFSVNAFWKGCISQDDAPRVNSRSQSGEQRRVETPRHSIARKAHSLPGYSLNVNKPGWALSHGSPAHRMSLQPICGQQGLPLSIAITTGRQERRVVRVPLWSSGLVTLPGQMNTVYIDVATFQLAFCSEGIQCKTPLILISENVFL